MSEWSNIFPIRFFPLIYKNLLEINFDQNIRKFSINPQGNLFVHQIPLSGYIFNWKIYSLIITDLIEDKSGYEKNQLKLIHNISDDIGTDSIDLVEILLSLEKTTSININYRVTFKTLTDLTDYLFFIFLQRSQKIKTSW